MGIEETVKTDAKKAKTATIEAFGDDMGGGASYCSNCDERVPEPYHLQLRTDCKKCGYTFTDIEAHTYMFGGSDF